MSRPPTQLGGHYWQLVSQYPKTCSCNFPQPNPKGTHNVSQLPKGPINVLAWAVTCQKRSAGQQIGVNKPDGWGEVDSWAGLQNA